MSTVMHLSDSMDAAHTAGRSEVHLDLLQVKVPWRHDDSGGSSDQGGDDDGSRRGWRGDVGGRGRFEDRDYEEGGMGQSGRRTDRKG